jgi:hypothetical protein
MELEHAPAAFFLLVPIIAILVGVGIATFRIYLNYRNRKEMFAMYHQERMAALDKGIELPPLPEDFFHDDGARPRRRSPHRTLLAGLVMLFIGLTLYLALYMTTQPTNSGGNVALFALIPVGIGLALLIYYFTVGRRLAEDMEAEQIARIVKEGPFKKP